MPSSKSSRSGSSRGESDVQLPVLVDERLDVPHGGLDLKHLRDLTGLGWSQVLRGAQQAPPALGHPKVLPFGAHDGARTQPLLLSALPLDCGPPLSEDIDEVARLKVVLPHPALARKRSLHCLAGLHLQEGDPRRLAYGILPLELGVDAEAAQGGEVAGPVDHVSGEPRVNPKDPLPRRVAIFVAKLVLRIRHLCHGPGHLALGHGFALDKLVPDVLPNPVVSFDQAVLPVRRPGRVGHVGANVIAHVLEDVLEPAVQAAGVLPRRSSSPAQLPPASWPWRPSLSPRRGRWRHSQSCSAPSASRLPRRPDAPRQSQARPRSPGRGPA